MDQTNNNSNSLLWEVSGKGLIKPSYYFGTMHLMCADDAFLSETVKKVIEEVEQIYLEVDMTRISTMANEDFEIKMLEGTTLIQLLSDNEYETIKLFFEKHQPHLPFSYLETQQPLMLSANLYELFLSCNEKVGIDTLIVREANSLEKPIKGLESIVFQSQLLNEVPYKYQAKELLKTINNLLQYEIYFKEMVTLYKAQDIENLHLMTTKEEAGIADYTNLLLYDRNRNWVKQFDAIARETPTLFAVGAGHLGGEEGVINLLRQSGYTLHPLIN